VNTFQDELLVELFELSPVLQIRSENELLPLLRQSALQVLQFSL
jgi:hypothetical protein